LCANLFRLRAERHANADLARALRDRVTQHSICSNGRQEQRDPGENSGEQRWRAARDQALRDARIHRAEIIDRQIRIGRAHQFSQRLSKRFRSLARSRDDEDVDAVGIHERQVDRALPLRFRELRLFYRADHTDNSEQFCVVRVAALKYALTKRAAIRPVAPGEILAKSFLRVFFGIALINFNETFAYHDARAPDPRRSNVAVGLLGTSQ
jgi:hypothetical protein